MLIFIDLEGGELEIYSPPMQESDWSEFATMVQA